MNQSSYLLECHNSHTSFYLVMHLLERRRAPAMQPALHKVKGVGRTWMLNGCACKGLLRVYAYVRQSVCMWASM